MTARNKSDGLSSVWYTTVGGGRTEGRIERKGLPCLRVQGEREILLHSPALGQMASWVQGN